MDLKANKVYRDRKDRKGILVTRDLKELQAQRDFKVKKATRATRERQVQRDLRGKMATLLAM